MPSKAFGRVFETFGSCAIGAFGLLIIILCSGPNGSLSSLSRPHMWNKTKIKKKRNKTKILFQATVRKMFYFCFISRPRTCKTNDWNNTETFFTDSAPLGKVGLLKPTSLLACLDLFLASVNYARKKASDSVFDSLFQKVSVTAEDLDIDISILPHVGYTR